MNELAMKKVSKNMYCYELYALNAHALKTMLLNQFAMKLML